MSRQSSANVREAMTDDDQGPGALFKPFIIMEELLDKLKLLDYEREFTLEMRMRPLNRHYFVLQTNPGEQFFVFSSLAAWLIRKTGKNFESPQEFDDPNSTIANILDHVRRLGVTIDFAPSKLKQGYGDQALFVLDNLSDEALRSVNFEWKTPVPPIEDANDDEEIDEEDAEVDIDRVEEDMLGVYSEEEEGDVLHIDDIIDKNSRANNNDIQEKPDRMMVTNTNAEEWRLEVERVTPQLKMTIKTDGRDWRSHLEQMHQHRDGIDECLQLTRTELDKLQAEIAKSLEKISSRERYINSQLQEPLTMYKQMSHLLAQTKEQYKQISGGLVGRSHLLSNITDELEMVKNEMEERGSSMTDGSPLINIRKSLARMKGEITGMDVRIGVIEHTMLQARVKNREILKRDINTMVTREKSKIFETLI